MVEVPPKKDTEKILKKATGMSRDEIKKEAMNLKKKFKGMVKTDDMAYYLLAKNKNVEVEIAGLGTEEINTKTAVNAQQQRGYIFRGFLASKEKMDKDRTRVVFADDMGTIRGTDYEGKLDEFSFGDELLLEGVQIFKGRGSDFISLSIRKGTEIKKVKGKGNISDIAIDPMDEEVEEGIFVKTMGIAIDGFQNGWSGCPKCKSKVDKKNKCPKCKERVKPKDYAFKRISISNGQSQTEAELAPEFDIPVETMLGRPLTVYGSWSDENNRISVCHIELAGEATLKKHEDFFEEDEEETEKPKKKSKKSSKKKVEEEPEDDDDDDEDDDEGEEEEEEEEKPKKKSKKKVKKEEPEDDEDEDEEDDSDDDDDDDSDDEDDDDEDSEEENCFGKEYDSEAEECQECDDIKDCKKAMPKKKSSKKSKKAKKEEEEDDDEIDHKQKLLELIEKYESVPKDMPHKFMSKKYDLEEEDVDDLLDDLKEEKLIKKVKTGWKFKQ